MRRADNEEEEEEEESEAESEPELLNEAEAQPMRIPDLRARLKEQGGDDTGTSTQSTKMARVH